MQDYTFIDLEGVNGCGKTFILDLLATRTLWLINDYNNNNLNKFALVTTTSKPKEEDLKRVAKFYSKDKDPLKDKLTVPDRYNVVGLFLKTQLDKSYRLLYQRRVDENAEILEERVHPIIFSDRWLLSTLVYGTLELKEDSSEFKTSFNAKNDISFYISSLIRKGRPCEQILHPDSIIYIKRDLQACMEYLNKRDKINSRYEKEENLQEILSKYEEYMYTQGGFGEGVMSRHGEKDRSLVVELDNDLNYHDLAHRDQIHERIDQVLKQVLPKELSKLI